jgi:hypothetical protein
MLLVELATKYEMLLGWELHDEVFKLPDGYFTGTFPGFDIPGVIAAVSELKNYLDSKGIDFLYVNHPQKNSREDDFIEGIREYSNSNSDELLKALSDQHIPNLDLRDLILAEGSDYHNLFYITDHHWKPETGLWAAASVAAYLNEHNGFSIDLSLFDPQKYRIETYKNAFLGSYGRKISLARTLPDDFCLLYPYFDTDISFSIPSLGLNIRGSFDVMYDYSMIDMTDYYNHETFGAYIYGDNAVVSMKNNLLFDGKKVLMIKTSFSRVLAPFFALGVEQLELLDIRHFSGSVKAYIEQINPDIVVVIYGPIPVNKMVRDNFDFR